MRALKKILFVGLMALTACRNTSCRSGYQGVSSEKGKYLYERHCASCHGVKGDGQGPVAQYLWPKPRDFTKGIFKYRTNRGAIPSDLDLLQIMYLGVPGTAMPGWYLLKKDDWESLLNYVKTFSPRLMTAKAGPEIDIPEEPKSTPESIQAGKKLFERSGCVACHGVHGEGDGPAANAIVDVWGNRVTPRNLTRGPMKWGNTSRGIYRTLSVGVPGTPMPSYEYTFTKGEMWNLVHYLQSIQKPLPEGYNPSDPKRGLFIVKKINGAIPINYENELWRQTPATPVFLKPLWYEPNATEWLTIKGLSNGKEIAFYIRWSDDQMNIEPAHPDGIAIQFPRDPVSNPIDLPYLGMGSSAKPVTIWQWKTGAFVTWNAFGVGKMELQKPSEQTVSGKGTYDQGEWHVIFMNAAPSSKEGYLSFAVWDGDLPPHHGPESFSEWLRYQVEE